MTKFNDISGGSTCPSQLLSWGSVWGVKFSPRQTGLSIKIGQSRTDLDIFVGTLCPWLSGVSMPGDGFLPAWRKAEAGWILWPGKKTTNIASRGSSRLPNTPFPNITYGANWLKVVNLGLALAVLFSPLLFPADLAGWQVIICWILWQYCLINNHFLSAVGSSGHQCVIGSSCSKPAGQGWRRGEWSL